jgi:tRNA modification GTPase
MIGGLWLTLIDTAGQEPAHDAIASVAQRQRIDQVSQADLVVWCVPPDASYDASADRQHSQLLVIHTKSDLVDPSASLSPIHEPNARVSPPLPLSRSPPLLVSAQTGAGLTDLGTAIVSRLSDPAAKDRNLLGTTAARCRDSLHGAAGALDRALAIARQQSDAELLAIELREALDEFGKMVGAVYTDDILDRIFSRFCIGK